MDDIAAFIEKASDRFTQPLIFVVVATGIYFTFKLRFVQIVRFREAVRETIASQQTSGSGALSPLQAFMTALAATIGTGNIVGVATAIVRGGPGALFWMWCYGFLAMATKFVEASLGMHYRVVQGEEVLSGPMYYLRDGVKSRRLAEIYALVGGLAVLFTTPLTQPNSVAVSFATQLKIHDYTLGSWHIGDTAIDWVRLIVGLVLAVLTWLVIVRGIKSIGRAAQKLSPLKVGLYLIGGVTVLATHLDRVPAVFASVFREAFSTKAVAGGTLGYAMMFAIRYGIARGVFANEAGYGTAAVAYGTAKSQRPDQQGLAAMMDVFIITYITSTISAMAVLLTGTWNVGVSGPEAVPAAFNDAIPYFGIGGWMVTISIFLFGYTVLIGWGFYGEQFLEYLFGPRIVVPFRWLYCFIIPIGAVIKVDAVWNWGDICNGMQVFPNVIGLLALGSVAAGYARMRHIDSAAEAIVADK